MSAKDGLYPAIWFECQSEFHGDLINDVSEAELWTQALFHGFGYSITQKSAARRAQSVGWRKLKGKWICPLCVDEEMES